MSVIKLSKKDIKRDDDKENEKIKLKRSNISYDSAMVSSWETSNKESFNTLNKYNESLNKNEWLSTDDLTVYRQALDSYVESSNYLRGINKVFAENYEDDEADWQKTIDSMESAYKSASEIYSKYDSADAYKKAVEAYEAQQKDYEEKLNFDLEVGKTEISDLESRYREATGIAHRIEILSNNPSYALSSKGQSKIEELRKLLAQYGNPSELESILSEKKAYYNLAERAQKAKQLASVSDPTSKNYDPAFAEKSQYQSTKFTAETFWDRFHTTEYDLGYDDLTHEYINGDEDFRAEVRRKYSTYSSDNPYSDGKSRFEEAGYDHMEDDEIAIYNYYYNTEGKDKAQEYLDSLEETLQYRYGTAMAEGVKGRPVAQYIFAVEAGLDQFGSGVASIFSDEYEPTSATQIASGQIREDLANTGAKLPDWLGGASLGQVGYDVVNTTANMLPSILASTAMNMVVPGSGAVVGAGLMGASAGGNAKAEMLQLGYSKEQANAYGLMVGVAEGGMEYLLGGITKLGGVLPDGIVGKILTKVDNAFARTAIKIGGSMLSEGFEEGLQTVIEPWLKEIATSVDWEDPSADEVLYSSLLGALSAFGLEGASTVAGEVNTYKQGKTIRNMDGAVGKLQSIGTTFSADTVAYKIASKVDAFTDAYTIGRLLNEVGGTISEQNVTDIANGLMAKGMDTTTANKLAKQYQAILNSEMNISDEQVKILENLSPLADVLRTNIIGSNTTVYQRTRAYSDIMSLADEVANGKKNKAAKTALAEKSSDTLKSSMNVFEQQAVDAELQKIASEVASGSRTSVAGQAVKKVVDSASSAAAEKLGVEGRYTSSDTGATRLASNKQKVNIVGVDSIEGKTMKLKLNDGSVVNADEIDFSSSDEALVYETVTNMGVNPNTAWEILKAYDPKSGQSGTIYAMGALEAYTYGHNGVKVDGMSQKGFSALLSPTQKNTAHKLGDIDARAKVEAQQKTIDKAVKSVRDEAKSKHKAIPKRKGETIFEGDRARLTDLQEKQLGVLEKVSNGLGVTFHIFESKVDAEGKRYYTMPDGTITSANGWYDPKTGEIWIDLYAGNDGQGTMIFTAAHELTHFIRQWSPAKFKVFADFLFEQYGKKGQDINQLIRDQIKKAADNGRSISWDEAYEEVIADSCETFLRDSKAAEKISALREKDANLANKIKTFLGQMLAKMRKVMADLGLAPETKEGKMVAGMTDSLQKLYDLWTDALADAGTAYSTIDRNLMENGIAVNSNTESASLMSVRYVLDSNKQQKVAEELATRFGVTVQEAKGWIDAETSLASIILNPKYSQYLDYTADENEEAIKSNSDYPQGTVDFSNICKKRRDFTEVMNRVLRNFPNHVFEATDLAKIRTIMSEEGMEVACGICYVEDRRQLDSIVAQDFIDSLALYRNGSNTRPDGKPFNANQLKAFKLIEGDNYTPSIYELISLEGRNSLKAKNPAMEEAWVKFNNARGMQSVRLLLNDAEYKRQILKYSPTTVKRKNDLGGLRIYSFSDMEMFHLIDVIQVITDSAAVGLSIQGYTKVNEYARAVKDTGEKLNRSLIPKGDLGYHMEGGKVVLDYDTVEGIDINHPDFFDNIGNPNIGNIVIGINPTQIRAAMTSKFIDQIIPFHTGQSGDVLGEKGIATWVNYKDFQSERDVDTQKKSSHQINIYTEVIDAAAKEGHPITNKVEFVNKFLEVCKENNLIPRFSDFLNVDENGDFVYTEGYHKFLVDFKTFDQNTGEYLPQKPVKPIFDGEYLTKLLKDYAKTQKTKDAKFAENMPKVLDRITNEIVKSDGVRLSDRDSEGNALSKSQQEFFKDSKVRWGESLMPVYHGTRKEFTVFDATKGYDENRVGGLLWAAKDYEYAKDYSYSDEPIVMKGYLNITNILDVGDIDSYPNYESRLQEIADLVKLTPSELEAMVDYKHILIYDITSSKAFRDRIVELGYDGVVAWESGLQTFGFVESSQFKNTTNKSPTSNPDIRYSTRETLAEASRKLTSISDEDYLKDKEANPFILVMEHTPKIVLDSMEGGNDRKILIRRDALYLAIRENGIQEGHYHGLGDKVLSELPKYLEEPDAIISTADNESRRLVLSHIPAKNGQAIISIEFESIKNFDGSKDYFNVVITVFDLHENYLKRLFKKNGAEIKYKKEDLAQSNPQLYEWLRIINAKSSKDSIAQVPDSVNSKSIKNSLRNVEPIETADYVKMYHHFGSTKNYDVAGYILGNGMMLDFSGKHWGDDYSTSRQVDHRDIQEVLGNRGSNNGVNAMIDMIGNGNIRLMPEVGGINLAVKPNATQMSQLRGYINHFKGEVEIDIDAVGGDTIHSFRYTRGTSSTKVLEDIKAYFDEGIVPEQKDEGETDIRQFLYSNRVTDKKTIDFLENQEHITTYKSFVEIDGKLYSPMATKVKGDDGKYRLTNPSEIGVWQQAEENPNSIPKFHKSGYGYYVLKKDDGGTVTAAYNPYEHSSNLVLNDQFEAAYQRPNLVTVECVIPKSEMTSGYKAKYAKDSTGYLDWKSGIVAGKLKGNKRKVYLSRWLKPVRILPESEVATMYKDILGTDISVPFNVVPPQLLTELEKVGVKIDYEGSPGYQYRQNKKANTDGKKLSDRSPDSVSTRSLLANALETTAQNDIERNKLEQYKSKIDLIESEYEKLTELRAKIKELSFAKGARDTKAIKDLQFQANQTANRINTYDRQLLNLESTTALKNVLNREKELARRKEAQKGKDALAKYKEKAAKTQRELMDRNTESRKKAIEGRNKTDMRHNIRNIVEELNNLLLNPTKDQHIPIGLQKPVASALAVINMDTVGADERIAKYNDLIAKAKDPDEIARLTKSRDNIEFQGENLKDKLINLQNAYAALLKSDDPLIKNAHNEAIENLIENTVQKVGDTSIRNMSLEQLEAVYDMFKAIKATVRNANKMFKEGKQETITANSEWVKREVSAAGGHRDRVLKATKWLKKFGWNMLKPIYAMKLIGSDTLTHLYENVRKGEDTWAVDVNEAKDFFKETAKKYEYNVWDFEKQYKFADSAGHPFSLSLEQIMSLYAYSKRTQADKHLELGGFIFDDSIEVTKKNKLGIPMKYEVNDANPYRLKKEDLAKVIDLLESKMPNVKGFVDEMQAYLSNVMGAKGNEVSLAMYDIKLYKEQNYFPLKTARYFREFDPEKNGTPKIKNSGFSKNTVPQAGNPIILSNFMDVWANHVNDMSMYHAFVLPLEDFMRVYNYSSTAGGYDSVQQYIKNAYGVQANSYIETLMNDLNGGARTDPATDLIGKGMSLFKKAAVFASASVVIQQPSAIARALAYIDAKYFVDKPSMDKHSETWAEVKKYAPVAIIKEMGYFDTNMGRSTVDWIKEEKTIRDKIDDVASKAPALADELAWCAIWKAVKREIADSTNLKVGSEEFLKMAGKRFTEVVTKTQVYDSVLSRSALMRSKDSGAKMVTAFMAEPTTSLNMVVDAIIEGKRGNKKFAGKVIGAVSASIILNSILVSLVTAARDDDDDETYAEKYLESITAELLDGFNPLTYIPLVKDIWSIMQGFDIERSDMSIWSDLWQSVENLFSDNKSGFEKTEGIVGSIASIFGLPAKNLMRDARAFYNLASTLLSGTPTTWAGVGEAVGGAVKDSIPLYGRIEGNKSKSDKLYDAIISGDQAHIDRVKSQYKDDKAIESAIRQGLRENDPRIQAAVQAVIENNQSERIRIQKEIIAEKNFKQDIVVEATNAEISYVRQKIKEARQAKKDGDKETFDKIVDTLIDRGYPKDFVMKALN